jgi:hypothetical protein
MIPIPTLGPRPIASVGATQLELLQWVVSRPAGFHRQPLSEPCVRLSPHTAPIRQTNRWLRNASVQRLRPVSGLAPRESGQLGWDAP